MVINVLQKHLITYQNENKNKNQSKLIEMSMMRHLIRKKYIDIWPAVLYKTSSVRKAEIV